MKALAPIQSIIHKCRTAQAKHAETSATFRRLQKQIDAMTLAETLIQKSWLLIIHGMKRINCKNSLKKQKFRYFPLADLE